MQITGDALLISAATLIGRNSIPSDEQISVAVAAAIQLAMELEKQNASGERNLERAQRDPYYALEVRREEMNR